MLPSFAAICLALLASSASSADVDSQEADAAAQPAVVGMSMLEPAEKISRPPASRMLGFSWSDCGPPDSWMKIHYLRLQPDYIKLDSTIVINTAFTITTSFGDKQPLEGSVEMQIKTFLGWMKVPCINKIGSCNYDNLCTAPPPPSTCPTAFIKAGVPCKCPFTAGNYTLADYAVMVDGSKFPGVLRGDYKVSLSLRVGGRQIFCINSELYVK